MQVDWKGEVLDFPYLPAEAFDKPLKVTVQNWEKCRCGAVDADSGEFTHPTCKCQVLIGEGVVNIEPLLRRLRITVPVQLNLSRPKTAIPGLNKRKSDRVLAKPKAPPPAAAAPNKAKKKRRASTYVWEGQNTEADDDKVEQGVCTYTIERP